MPRATSQARSKNVYISASEVRESRADKTTRERERERERGQVIYRVSKKMNFASANQFSLWFKLMLFCMYIHQWKGHQWRDKDRHCVRTHQGVRKGQCWVKKGKGWERIVEVEGKIKVGEERAECVYARIS